MIHKLLRMVFDVIFWLRHALNGRFLKQARNGMNGEVERGFRNRPLRANRLAERHGCLVCPVSECPQESGQSKHRAALYDCAEIRMVEQ
jgi:hypothetical protein